MPRATRMNDDQDCLTTTIPEAGKKAFNLGKNASYDAAHRGDIPVIKVGRLLRVPKSWLRKLERAEDGGDSR
jgi:hypothetical protein